MDQPKRDSHSPDSDKPENLDRNRSRRDVPAADSRRPEAPPAKSRRPKAERPAPRVLSSGEVEAIKKRFRIQRRRLGKIMQIQPDGKFGFISAEDYREDVFFHRDVWDGRVTREGREVTVRPEPGMWVEFEIDEEKLELEQRLRAKIVRPTDRPIGRKLSGRDATFKIVTHHPRARRKRPDWRKE